MSLMAMPPASLHGKLSKASWEDGLGVRVLSMEGPLVLMLPPPLQRHIGLEQLPQEQRKEKQSHRGQSNRTSQSGL